MKKFLWICFFGMNFVSAVHAEDAKLPQGTFIGTGDSVLDDRKARKCEKITLRVYEYPNGYDFDTTSKCEGLYFETPMINLKIEGTQVKSKTGKVIGSFVDGQLKFSQDLGDGFRFEFNNVHTKNTVKFELKMVYGSEKTPQRHVWGELKF